MDKPINREGVERLRQFQEQLLKERGGVPFEDSVELIRQMREERDRELGIADEDDGMLEVRPLTPGHPPTQENLDKLKEISERLYRENNCQFFEDSVEDLRQIRKERLRQLMGED